jgi:hypothetical protein
MFGLTCFSVTGFSCSIRCDCLPDGAVLYYCCVSTFPCKFSSVWLSGDSAWRRCGNTGCRLLQVAVPSRQHCVTLVLMLDAGQKR